MSPVTAPSSSSPVVELTIMPTQITQTMQFTQSLTMTIPNGCSGLNQDVQSQTALIQTTAQSLQISTSDVSYAGCVSSNTAKTNLLDVTISVSANMNVVIPLVQFSNIVVPSNETSIKQLFNSLQNNLNNTINTGAFTKLLATASAKLNATTTSQAVISKSTASGLTVNSPPTQLPTTAPFVTSNSAPSDSNMGMIIGIVIGAAAVSSFAVCFLILYLRSGGNCSKDYSGYEFDEEDVHISSTNIYPSSSGESVDSFGRDKERTSIIIPDSSVTEDSWSPCCN